jgi:hypothetical protein
VFVALLWATFLLTRGEMIYTSLAFAIITTFISSFAFCVYDKIQAVYLLKPDNLWSRSLGNIPSHAGRYDCRKPFFWMQMPAVSTALAFRLVEQNPDEKHFLRNYGDRKTGSAEIFPNTHLRCSHGDKGLYEKIK